MDVEILREYLVFAKYLNITKAASILHLAPSSLSRHLAILEKEVGAQLTTHVKSPDLTQAGLTVLNEATKIISSYDHMLALVSKLNADTPSTITLAFIQEDRTIVDRVLKTASKQDAFPGFDIHTTFIEHDSSFEALKSGKADIAIMYSVDQVDTQAYEVVPFLSDRIVAALPKNGEFAGRSSVSIKELANYSIFSPAPKKFEDYHMRIMDIFKMYNIEPNIRYFNTGNMDEFYAYDASDRSWFFVKSQIEDYRGSLPAAVFENSVLCEVEEKEARVLRYIVTKKHAENPLASKFAHLLARQSEL